MYAGNEQIDFGLDRYRDMMRASERRRRWAEMGRSATESLLQAIRASVEWLVGWYDRRPEVCFGFEPACEMPLG